MQLQVGGRFSYSYTSLQTPSPHTLPYLCSSNFTTTTNYKKCCITITPHPLSSSASTTRTNAMIGAILAAAVILSTPAPPEETFSNIPPMLSSELCGSKPQECQKKRIQKPKSRNAESCTTKCLTTCIQGGDGAPGEGPLNVRRLPIVVFKQGFRSRKYCLVECSDICNLLDDAEKKGR